MMIVTVTCSYYNHAILIVIHSQTFNQALFQKFIDAVVLPIFLLEFFHLISFYFKIYNKAQIKKFHNKTHGI